MKKAVLRKLIEMSNKVLGKEETNKVVEKTIEETVKKIKEDIKPKKKKGDK